MGDGGIGTAGIGLLRLSPGEAEPRVRAADNFAPRATVTGEPLQAVLGMMQAVSQPLAKPRHTTLTDPATGGVRELRHDDRSYPQRVHDALADAFTRLLEDGDLPRHRDPAGSAEPDWVRRHRPRRHHPHLHRTPLDRPNPDLIRNSADY